MKKILVSLILVLSLMLSACGNVATVFSASQAQNSAATTANNTAAGINASAATSSATSVTEALAANGAAHDDLAAGTNADDEVWDSASEIAITLNGNTLSASGEGVAVNGATATISAAGVYRIHGTLDDGQIIVQTTSKETVRLILDGAELHSSTSSPLAVMKAEKVMIILAENTQNVLTDAKTYASANAEENEPNAALFSKASLTITGTGSLTVNGNYNDGIASKDGLIIRRATLNVTAVDDGIRGKDYLVIQSGQITVNAQANALKADNAVDAALGYILVEGGALNLTSGGDALQATTDALITGGEFTITSGGGSKQRLSSDVSAKGIKGTVSVMIEGGSFTIDAADDALHTNGVLTVNGGTFNIATGDDGMHADANLTINGGDIQITRSYEGIESALITINDGNISVVSSDDGVNVASGNDGSGQRGPGGPGQQDTFTSYTGSKYLYIHGGSITVNAGGDGVDVNGAIQMTGGVLLVNGPTEQMNGPLDYDSGFQMTGGIVVATGSAGMAQTPDASSSQNALLVYFTNTQSAGTLVHLQNSAGEDILTFAPSKEYQSLAFSSPALANGTTYQVYTGGSSTGVEKDGLYQGGTYTAGTQAASFKISSVVTTVGSGGGNRFRRP